MTQDNSTFKTQNLKLINRIFLSPPHIGSSEQRLIKEVFDSNFIAPFGPQLDAFEREFCEYTRISYCVALSSGTAAMHLSLCCLGISQGDEIFASTLTFVGSVSPAIFLGATPVFIDCDKKTWNMDPELLLNELESCKKKRKLPKAVIPTDLYGQCCDLERIVSICDQYGVPVVCDSAEAMGAKYRSSEAGGRQPDPIEMRSAVASEFDGARDKAEDRMAEVGQLTSDIGTTWHHAGVGAKAAVFSFNGNKIVTTSGGGMLVSEDEEFIRKAKFLSQQARDPAPHYEHSQIGYNYRMSNVLAAIGRGQLRVLDERVKEKRKIFNYYQDALGDIPGIEFMPEAPYGRSNRWLSVILITPEKFGTDREALRKALETEKIEARPVWKPMHLQPVFQVEGRKAKGERRKAEGNKKRYEARVIGGKVAEDLFTRGLCLPSGTAMKEEDLNRIIDVIKSCRK